MTGSTGLARNTKDGSLVTVDVAMKPVKDGTGRTALAANKRDITHLIYLRQSQLPEGARLLILVIEDDSRDRQWLVETLSGAGYSVESVTTGAAAIDRARARAFDAITLDLLLPDMSGQDLLRAIRSEDLNRETPVIVASVVAERGVATGYHVLDVLTEPVGAADLLRVLARARVAAVQTPGLDGFERTRLLKTALEAGSRAFVARHRAGVGEGAT